MVRISVLYPNEPGKRFDLAGGGAAPAPFVAACHLYFNAAADFEKGIGAHGKEIMGDIPNYTDLAPQIQVSEIVVA